MGLNVARKIIGEHLISGEMVAGSEISIKIDQTLTQDSTGTMAYLQLEAMGIDRVKTKRSVAYIDHNMLQSGPENADDHLYIQTVASKYGVYFSKPGNGICHQVHLERFSAPGETLLGSDSHTPTCGGAGMLAIGAGGLNVAAAMAGIEYSLVMPHIVKVELKGRLKGWASAKDIILELLRRLTVKGGVNKIFEYSGEGVKTLTVPERATIANMGAELGATTSLFPSDERTLEFLKAQGRGDVYRELKADIDAEYDDEVIINLNELTPMIACPHSPDNVYKVDEVRGKSLTQVAIGSCTNSSYRDLEMVARMLTGKRVADSVSLVISPGSRQVLSMLAKSGALASLINAGARILESACGPCIGMGQAPCTDGVSLRTFNRNFEGRCGTKSAGVYIGSPEVAAASAVAGYITEPDYLGKPEDYRIDMPESFDVDDGLIIEPYKGDGDIKRGPNIKPFPRGTALEDSIEGRVLIKLGDNITTDHIMPSNASLLPYRSNVPYLSNYCLTPCDSEFPRLAREYDGGFIVAGSNYGQGSSREHAALAPLYLGVKGVFAKSFARIHRANLINSGIIPMVFKNPGDYEEISKLDKLVIKELYNGIEKGEAVVLDLSNNKEYKLDVLLSDEEKDMIKCGGYLNYIGQKSRA